MGPSGRRHHRQIRIPPLAILALGILGTGAGIVWAGGLHDAADGTPLLDDTVAKILIALLGTASTILGLLLQRTGNVEHELKPNSGTSARDSMNRTEEMVAKLVDQVGHLERTHRQQGVEILQLREDQQQTRSDLSGQAADIRGIRKDIGRVADVLTKGNP